MHLMSNACLAWIDNVLLFRTRKGRKPPPEVKTVQFWLMSQMPLVHPMSSNYMFMPSPLLIKFDAQI